MSASSYQFIGDGLKGSKPADRELDSAAYDVYVELELPEELSVVLANLSAKGIFKRLKRRKARERFRYDVLEIDYYKLYFKKAQPNKYTVKSLTDLLNVLNLNQDVINHLPENEIAAIDQFRLYVMHAVYKEVDKKGRQPVRKRNYHVSNLAKISAWVQKHWPLLSIITFGVLFIVGVVLDALYNYAGFYSILSLIPVIPLPLLIGVCLALTVLNLMLYVALEGIMLGEMFDIRPKAAEKRKLDAWQKQFEMTGEINERINDTYVRATMEKDGSTSLFQKFNNQCDRTIYQRQLAIKDEDVNEAPGRRRARIALIFVGALLSVGSACFGALSMAPVLPVILPFIPFLATPAGIAIFVAVVVVSVLVSYFAMQRKGLAQILSPNLEQRVEVGKSLDEYHDRQERIDIKAINTSLERQNKDAESSIHTAQGQDLLSESESDGRLECMDQPRIRQGF